MVPSCSAGRLPDSPSQAREVTVTQLKKPSSLLQLTGLCVLPGGFSLLPSLGGEILRWGEMTGWNTLMPSLISMKMIRTQNFSIKETVVRLLLTRKLFASFSPKEDPSANTNHQKSCRHSPGSSQIMDQICIFHDKKSNNNKYKWLFRPTRKSNPTRVQPIHTTCNSHNLALCNRPPPPPPKLPESLMTESGHNLFPGTSPPPPPSPNYGVHISGKTQGAPISGSKTFYQLMLSLEFHFDAEVRKAAVAKCDKILAITLQNIVAAEAHYHKTCYRNYTKDEKPKVVAYQEADRESYQILFINIWDIPLTFPYVAKLTRPSDILVEFMATMMWRNK